MIKSSPPEALKEVMSELLRGELFNIQDNLKKARELFREFRNELIQLYKEGVFKKLTILQVLYLLANFREFARKYDNYEDYFQSGVKAIIKTVNKSYVSDPFEYLKQVFYIPRRRTSYDFLLSNLLQEIIEDIFMELLEKEMEKIEARQKVKR